MELTSTHCTWLEQPQNVITIFFIILFWLVFSVLSIHSVSNIHRAQREREREWCMYVVWFVKSIFICSCLRCCGPYVYFLWNSLVFMIQWARTYELECEWVVFISSTFSRNRYYTRIIIINIDADNVVLFSLYSCVTPAIFGGKSFRCIIFSNNGSGPFAGVPPTIDIYNSTQENE